MLTLVRRAYTLPQLTSGAVDLSKAKPGKRTSAVLFRL